jgi:fructose-bisphosphate aldolase class 1
MNQQMFEQVKAGKGFIAALDQSGGSTSLTWKGSVVRSQYRPLLNRILNRDVNSFV